MSKELQNETDIVALILKMQEKLAALDKKVDVLVSRSGARSVENRPVSRPSSDGPIRAFDPVPSLPRMMEERAKIQEPRPAKAQEQRPGRPVFQVTCAECKKECEIPFKPTGDRPVYCKECFNQRKAAGRSKAPVENKPEVVVPAPVVETPVPQAADPVVKEVVKDKKKPAAKKPVAAKKKPVAKKKK